MDIQFTKRRNESPVRAVRSSRGFTLLEVILALAILGVAIAVISQSFRMAHRSAMESREITTAQLLASTKMAEVSAGITPAVSVEGASFEDVEDWVYSLAVEPLDEPVGLVSVTVVVTPAKPNPQASVRFALTRWMSEEEIVTTEDTEGESSESEAGESESGSESGASEGSR